MESTDQPGVTRLENKTASRSIWLVLASAFALACLGLALAGSTPAGASVSPQQALVNLNEWRAKAGIPPVEALDPRMTEGCRLHNRYIQKTGRFGHDELASSPWYTELGAEAGGSSVLHSAEAKPYDAFHDAVYHRTSLLFPRISTTGFSASFGNTCMSVFERSGPSSEQLKLYPWPHDGQERVPLRFTSRETPNPYDEAPGTDQLGYLLSVSVNGPWSSWFFESRVESAELVDEHGLQVPVAISDISSKHGRYMDGGFGLFPLRALDPGRRYTAHAKGEVSGRNGNKSSSLPFNLTWRFRTVDAPPLRSGLRLKRIKQSKRSVQFGVGYRKELAGKVARVRIEKRLRGQFWKRVGKFDVRLSPSTSFRVKRPHRGTLHRITVTTQVIDVNHRTIAAGTARTIMRSWR